MRLATRLDRLALLRMVGSRGSSRRFEPPRTSLGVSRAGVTGASPKASPIRRSAALGYVDTLLSVCAWLSSRSATWKTRRVGRRVAQESADLRGDGHVSRTTALSTRLILRNPTRRVNHTKSHAARLARPAFPGSMIRNVTTELRNTRQLPHTVRRTWASLIRMVRAAR